MTLVDHVREPRRRADRAARLGRIGLLVAVLAATPFLSGCVITPQFLACLTSGALSSLQCQEDSIAPGPPAAPTGLTATPQLVGVMGPWISLDWHDNEEPDLQGYQILWSRTPGGPYSSAGFAEPSSYGDTCLTAQDCHLYTCPVYYVVEAYDKVGQFSPPSNEASARLECDPPPAPTGVAAKPVEGEVDVTWDAGQAPVSTYRVYRSESASGPFTLVDDNEDTTEYDDPDVQAGTTYFYRVTAVNSAGRESEPSEVVSATPIAADHDPPGAPTGLTATAGDGRVQLDWDDNPEPDLDHYIVLRSRQPIPGGPAQVFTTTVSEYLDTGLSNDTTYYYFLRAVDHRGNRSDFSAVVPATPTAGEAPSAPTGLTATGDYVGVHLDWDDNGEANLAGYKVYRSSAADGPFSLLAQPTASEYDDFDVPVDQPLFYYVTAVDTDGHESAPSDTVSATACGSPGCGPGRPTGALRAAANASGIEFKLTVHSGYGGSGSVSVDGDRIVGDGLLFSGPFTLKEPVGGKAPRTIGGTWHSRVDWHLSPGTGTGGATGVGLVTLAAPETGQACLRFTETYIAHGEGAVIALGKFVSLGGTGKAAKLLGTGTYRVKPGPDGSLVYKGKARPAAGAGSQLPQECQDLARPAR